MTTFKDLHLQDEPLLIANVWDAVSAKAAEKLNFKALGTSSGAVAAILGYPDGEKISFDQLAFMVKHIAAAASIPLSVDMEGGYSREASEIIENMKQLADMGVVGVNFEDSVVTQERVILNQDDFAKTLGTVKNQLIKDHIDLYLNVRTDAFLLKMSNPLDETLSRIKAYESAGADGIFVPFIVEQDDIKQVTQTSALPLNVLGMPGLPGFQTLKELGVRRISMGSAVFHKMRQYHETNLEMILKQNSFEGMF